ncbi:hypothetical protein [Cupriavidus sp. CuC1]|uniref:hypothetical protein n=1 Tax=Cupriavidus sp. CuC1 TaxID=3373131 RepID=UPI0037D86760
MRISTDDFKQVADIVKATPQLRRARLYTPETAQDYYTNDGPSPPFAMQLDFDTLAALEATIAVDGYLQALARLQFPSLTGCVITQQVMARRPFPVDDPIISVAKGNVPCSFLVHYPGHAEDFDAWINYYLTHHPQIMRLFDGIREIEIFTRVDWLDAMPWQRVHYMQRNKQVFDSAAAITAAMNSPVRHQMREDFEKFPPFVGSNVHFPMATHTFTFT